jgi:hypothetical protein
MEGEGWVFRKKKGMEREKEKGKGILFYLYSTLFTLC